MAAGAFARPVLMVDASLREAPEALLAGFGDALSASLVNADAEATPRALWGVAVVSMLLTQRVRRARLAELLDVCPPGAGGWWTRLRLNVVSLARELEQGVGAGDGGWRFGLALDLTTEEADRDVLDAMTVDATRERVRLGVRGFCDAYEPASRTLVEVKVSLGGLQRNPAPLWVAQGAIYSALAAEPGSGVHGYAPRQLLIADLGGGALWSTRALAPVAAVAAAAAAAAAPSPAAAPWPVSTPLQAAACDFLSRLMTRERFRPEHVQRALRRQR